MELKVIQKKAIFKKLHPYFPMEKLDHYSSYSLETTKNNQKTCKISYHKTEFYLHSRYNPDEEAKVQTANIDLQINDVLFVLGIGLGYHLTSLLKRYPDNYFIIVESDLRLYRTFIENADDDLLNNKKIIFLTDHNLTDLNSIIACLRYLIFKKEIKLKMFKFPVLFEKNPAFREIENIILSEFSTFYSNQLTDLNFIPLWKRNLTANSRYFSDFMKLNELNNKYTGQPMILVSAGPGLEKNIDFIKQKRQSMIVVTVDTALRYLIKNDIIPDFVISLDSKYENFYDFKFINDLTKIKLVFDLTSFPKIQLLFKEKYCTYTVKLIRDFQSGKTIEYRDEYLMPLIREKGDPGGLQSGGSVSTNALDFALFTNADPIYMIGLDLKYTDYKTHCRGCYKEFYFLPRINKIYNFHTLNFMSVITRENIKEYGDEYHVYHYDYIMRKYRKWFQDAIQLLKNKNIKIID